MTRNLTRIFAVAGLALGFSTPALAQDQAAASGTLDEVFVQGTRQVTSQQTTPLAITTISEERIEQRFVDDIRGIADLAPNVVMENITGFNALAIGIRGTGTNDIITTIDSAVGVIVDEFALVHTQGQIVDPFDVEAIEILRGPQGTLFGKNTTGGVVIVRTKRPVHNEYTGKIQLRAGNIGTLEGRVAVNIPILEDVLSARLVATYQQDHGQYTNDKQHTIYGVAGSPTPLGLPVNGDGRNLDGTDVFFGRGKILLTPSDTYEAVLTFEILRDRSDTPPAINETPADGQLDKFGIPRGFLFNPIGFPGFQQTCPGGEKAKQACIFSTGVSFRDDGLRMERGHRMEMELVSLDQELDLDTIVIELFLGYRYQKERLPSTYTGEAFPSLFDATRNLEREQFQGELRFTSNFEGKFNFIFGGAYFLNNNHWRAMSYVGFTAIPFLGVDLGPLLGAGISCDIANPDYENGSGNIVPGLFVGGNGCLTINPTANDRPNFAPLVQKADAVGAYAEFYYDISDKLRLTAGLRYSYEEKSFKKWNGTSLTPDEVALFGSTDGGRALERTMMLNTLTPGAPGRFAFAIDDSRDWDNVTFKAVVDYQVNDDTFVYFSFNQGFKSGSFVETCTSIGTCQPFEEESADSFEIGYKSDMFDQTVRVNVAAFYTKISDVVRSQVVQIINRFGDPDQETQFGNIAGQENYGLELEVTWLVTDDFRVNLTAHWLDSSYTEFFTDLDGGEATDPATGLLFASVINPECFNVDGSNDDAKCAGVRPNFAQKWSVGADFTYDLHLGNSGMVIWNANIHYSPEYEYSVFNSDFTQIQSRTLIGLSATWIDPQDRWQLSVFVKNLLDETYRVSANSVAGLWNFSQYGQNRRWGVEGTFNF